VEATLTHRHRCTTTNKSVEAARLLSIGESRLTHALPGPTLAAMTMAANQLIEPRRGPQQASASSPPATPSRPDLTHRSRRNASMRETRRAILHTRQERAPAMRRLAKSLATG
jgi:hypothetical protein